MHLITKFGEVYIHKQAMMWSLIVIFFMLCLNVKMSFGKASWVSQSSESWDAEWKAGSWNYMDSVPIERARLAIIGDILIPFYSSKNASILDVGCGTGTLLDFLPSRQRPLYLGIDVSNEAIDKARKMRRKAKFEVAVAHEYKPKQNFDVIIFSEMLYYVDFQTLLIQYEKYLSPKGIIISSLFFKTEDAVIPNRIFSFLENNFHVLDDFQVVGRTRRAENSPPDRVMSHIQVVRKRSI
jgi:SAM-dependent methyltransferase